MGRFNPCRSRRPTWARTLWARVCRYGRDQDGNIVVISAFMIPVLLGAFGLGFEGAHWYQARRAMQNAADSAALAASMNGGTNYDAEAKAVTAQYGYADGVNDVVVTVSNTATCPAGGADCYSVNISKPIPLYLMPLVGYQGDATVDGSRAKLITALAIATASSDPREYCILALASSGTTTGIRTNGSPNADLQHCNVMSNTASDCNGHNLNAGYGDAHTSSSGCGFHQAANLPTLTDPYAYLASAVPSNTCSDYPKAPAKKHDDPLPASNQLSGNVTWGAVQIFCGDVQLTDDVNVTTASPGTVLVIENGQLDTNGHTLKSLANMGLTVVFSGTSGSYAHGPTGGGTLDFAAPTSGTWSGVAIYQDPSLTSGIDIAAAGNSPTWDLTGLVYLPHASVTFSGVVNKASNGHSCFGLVVDNVTINGTASIFDEGECAEAGLALPKGSSQTAQRGALAK
jgi:hypothetical protein